MGVADMGERPSNAHSIDRIDNDGNYEPGNCRWATHIGQATNRRSTHIFSFRGESKTLNQWSRELDIPVATLRKRLAIGWSVRATLETPIQTKFRNRIASK